MADKKKTNKDAIFTMQSLAATVLSLFMLMAVMGGGRFCLLGGMLSVNTVFALTASMMALIILNIACTRKKEDGSLKEFPVIVSAVGLVFCLICLITGFVKDISDTKIKDEYHISEDKSIVLTETTVKNKYTETVRSYITVYLKGGATAKKLGEVDESMFAVNCIESGNYDCSFDNETEVFTLTCYHGGYGHGEVYLAYDDGSLVYKFPVKYKTKGQKKHEEKIKEEAE